MSALPRVIVTGLGRCGSSLTMQMLAAGGLRALGKHPTYEVPQAMLGSLTRDWLDQQQNCAIKILDPHRLAESVLNLPGQRIIWLDRNLEQQALSQVKFMRVVLEVPLNRKGVRGIESTLRQDTGRCHRLLSMVSVPVLRLRFEHLVTHPAGAAETIAAFLAPLRLDIGAMARTVVPRSPFCLPGLLELDLAS